MLAMYMSCIADRACYTLGVMLVLWAGGFVSRADSLMSQVVCNP